MVFDRVLLSNHTTVDNQSEKADLIKRESFDLRKRDTVERENQVLKKQVDECKIVLGTIITATRKVAAIYSQLGLLQSL